MCKNGNLKFSIITPVYNCEQYISKAVESVLVQTYDNWELILVDDGSTDGSGEICDSYNINHKIKIIHQTNQGEFNARMTAIAHVSGDYVIGLDADDWLEAQALETLYGILQETGYDVVNYRWKYTNEELVSPSPIASGIYDNYEYLRLAILYTRHSLCDKAIKVELFKNAKWIIPDRKLTLNADYLQIMPLLCQAKKIYVTNRILYNYRAVAGSLSQCAKFQNITDTEYVSIKVEQILRLHNILDQPIYDAMHIAYLKMIAGRMTNLICSKSISNNDLRFFYKLNFYQQCFPYERKKYWNTNQFFLFFVLRHRMFIMIRIQYAVFKKLKQLKKQILRI